MEASSTTSSCCRGKLPWFCGHVPQECGTGQVDHQMKNQPKIPRHVYIYPLNLIGGCSRITLSKFWVWEWCTRDSMRGKAEVIEWLRLSLELVQLVSWFLTAENKSTIVKYLCGVLGELNSHSFTQFFPPGGLVERIGCPKTSSELSSEKGWVERAPWAVCLLYKLLGSNVLFYLPYASKSTGMKVVMIIFTIITR